MNDHRWQRRQLLIRAGLTEAWEAIQKGTASLDQIVAVNNEIQTMLMLYGKVTERVYDTCKTQAEIGAHLRDQVEDI